MASRVTALASQDGHRRCTNKARSGATVITSVITWATMPAADCSPAQVTISPATILRGWTAAARLTDAFPNAVMVHTPVHASWLNQVEIYLSVIERKLLTPDNFASLEELAEQITAFEPGRTTPPDHSTGDSPTTTSTGSSTGSPPDSDELAGATSWGCGVAGCRRRGWSRL